jgi:UvrB/uvrC motif
MSLDANGTPVKRGASNEGFAPARRVDVGEGGASQVLMAFGAGHAEICEQVRPLSPGDDDELAQVRRQKAAAIEANDYERAAALRDRERQLLANRAQRGEERVGDVDLRVP